MIRSVTVKNYRGESLTMSLTSYMDSGLLITNIDGLGAPDADISIADLATSDGGLFGNAHAQPRTITITVEPQSKSNVEQTRHLLYRYFPIKKLCRVTFDTTERVSSIEGYVSKIEPDIFSQKEEVKVEIKCPYPFFHDISELHQQTFFGIDKLFFFPFSNDLDHFPVHVMHIYHFTTNYSSLTEDKEYYIHIPDLDIDLQFMSPGTGQTFNGIWEGEIRIHTIDGIFADGTIELGRQIEE